MLSIYHNGAGSGDWYKVFLKGELYYEGHSIPVHVWLKLLWDLNVIGEDVLFLTDEQMEEL